MPDEGFGSQLWKNVRAVRLGEDGGLELPVRAHARDGVVIGVDAIARSEAAAPKSPRPQRRWWRRRRPV